MGGPSLLIILHKDRGLDARHGAKQLDNEGRLKFHFQSFVSFNVAHKTIMALWKVRFMTPEQKVQLVEEESETEDLQNDESGSFLGIEEAKMSEVYSSTKPFDVLTLLDIFEGGPLEHQVMEKVGCIDYSASAWETVYQWVTTSICIFGTSGAGGIQAEDMQCTSFGWDSMVKELQE
ncbi:hypothetical protein GUJ93_ZPchr0006g46329 [Zizania palustris]|uniref:Uncharacterized protein n=1 Tax=Zizania palustris TaxID=103762 RepID=A0A8J5W4L9_ZIZPA|nr:hypothetical protein GUJ93_ZPchr0006g46329 [Zizania palustris]